MYIFPTGFYSNRLFSALRKSRAFEGGRWVAVALPYIFPESSWEVLLPSVSVRWRNKDHQPDSTCRPLNMSGKAVGWIRCHRYGSNFHYVILNRALLLAQYMTWKIHITNCYKPRFSIQAWLELAMSLAQFLPSLCLYSPSSGMVRAWGFPEKYFLVVSWHKPMTFACPYHHWPTIACRTTLSPRHHVPRKLLTVWKEAKD